MSNAKQMQVLLLDMFGRIQRVKLLAVAEIFRSLRWMMMMVENTLVLRQITRVLTMSPFWLKLQVSLLDISGYSSKKSEGATVSDGAIIGNPATVHYLRGCLHGRCKALGRSWKAEQLFVCFICRTFGRNGYQVEKEIKKNCRPLAAERLAAAMFVLFVSSTRIFRAKVVYMVLGSSYL